MKIFQQRGFTLVELAIVLVIVGLLLGGVLKGQELINSARVRNLADQNSGIQAAYYGFIDRFRRVPGDWDEGEASQAIGVTVNTGGNGNGRIDNTLVEAAAVWEQLAKSNFITGGFTPAAADPATEAAYANNAPNNAFGNPLVLTRNSGYTDVNANPSDRLNLHMGSEVPVNIARELDTKVDDGLPNTGVLRLTRADGDGVFDADNFSNNFVNCSTDSGANGAGNTAGDGTTAAHIYDIFDDEQDCGPVFIY